MKILCYHHNDDCLKCNFLKDCFPKTHKLRQQAIEKKWRDKYGDEF